MRHDPRACALCLHHADELRQSLLEMDQTDGFTGQPLNDEALLQRLGKTHGCLTAWTTQHLPRRGHHRMTTTEATISQDEARATEATARAALVDNEAIAALSARGCTAVDLFLPSITKDLKAINVGDEGNAELRVYAVDRQGAVRTGPKGPMKADDVLADLIAENPAYLRFFNR